MPTDEERSSFGSLPNDESGETDWPNQTPTTPVVLSSAGIVRKAPDRHAASKEHLQRRASDWPRMASTLPGTPRYFQNGMSQSNGANQPVWSSPSAAPTLENTQPTSARPGDGEDMYPGGLPPVGQESMAWYDQLFDSSFSALDNPFLAGAQFDSSIDPTWSYLT